MKKLLLLSAGAAAFGLAACGSGGGGGGDTPAVLGQVQFGEMDSTDLKWALDVSGGATYSFASKRTLDAAIPQTYLPIDQLNLNSKPAGAKDFIQLPISADSTAHATLTAGAGGNAFQLKLFVRLGNATSDTTYTYYFKSYDAATNPYGVYGPGDLSYVRNVLDATYQQRKNIVFNVGDATAKLGIADYDTGGWLPIGDNTYKFTGSYNGGGLTIDKLHLSRPTKDYQGLFGTTSGSITKLGLTNLDVKGQSNVGGLVGAQNGGSISQAYASGAVSSPSGGYVGGLVGLQWGSISQTYATGAVSSTSGNYVGGLVGYQYSGSIAQAYASGTVSSASGGAVGGLVGWQNSGSIAQAYASGAVSSASGNSVGGLVGLQSGSISQAYATGAVSSASGGAVGGLVGGQEGSIAQAYATGDVSSASGRAVGGLVGQQNSGSIAQAYATGAVSSTSGNYVGGLVGGQEGSISNVYYKKQPAYTGVGGDATGIADTASGAKAVTTGATDLSFAGFIWTDQASTATAGAPANNIWTRTGAVIGGANGNWPVFGGAWLSTGWGDTTPATQTLQPLP